MFITDNWRWIFKDICMYFNGRYTCSVLNVIIYSSNTLSHMRKNHTTKQNLVLFVCFFTSDLRFFSLVLSCRWNVTDKCYQWGFFITLTPNLIRETCDIRFWCWLKNSHYLLLTSLTKIKIIILEHLKRNVF